MQPWKTTSRRTLLSHGQWLTVESHTIQLPDEQIIEDWPWIITPDYVNVVAVTAEDEFLCFRQTKYAVQGTSLAPVGGYIEENEYPLKAAQRELLEETGYAAADWVSLGQYAVDGNRGAGTAHLFLAKNTSFVGEAESDELEAQALLHLSRAEVEAALRDGEFKVLGWAAAVALALQFLQA